MDCFGKGMELCIGNEYGCSTALTLEWIIVTLIIGTLISSLSLLTLKLLQVNRNPQDES